MATNAIKYGALASEERAIAVQWSVGSDAKLRLVWRERGARPAAQPTKVGFGALLIERTLGGGGKSAQMEFAPDGLVCTLEIAVS